MREDLPVVDVVAMYDKPEIWRLLFHCAVGDLFAESRYEIRIELLMCILAGVAPRHEKVIVEEGYPYDCSEFGDSIGGSIIAWVINGPLVSAAVQRSNRVLKILLNTAGQSALRRRVNCDGAKLRWP